MLRSNRVYGVGLLLTMIGGALFGCGTAGHSSPTDDAGVAGLSGAGPIAAGPPISGGAAAMDAGTHEAGGDAAAAGRRDAGLSEPTVVYAQDGVLAGLALAGDTLYASVAARVNVEPMTAGSIVSVPKGATNAALGAGATTVVAGISPRAIAAVDGRLYWDEGGLGSAGAVMTTPIAGGTPQALFAGGDGTYVQTRFVIVNGVMYVMSTALGVARVIWSAPLAAPETRDVLLRSHGDPVTAIDADGANVFFLANSGTRDELGLTIVDLEEVEPNSGGNGVLRLWPAAAAVHFPEYMFLVGDEKALYWSDGNTIRSFPKAPTTADVPTVVATLATPSTIDVQLLIDGPNLYVLTPNQLLRVAKTGGAATVLASSSDGTFDQSPTNALGMVVDDVFIYFLDAGHGRILKLPK